MAAGFLITPQRSTSIVHGVIQRGTLPAVENNASDVLGCQVIISEIDGRT